MTNAFLLRPLPSLLVMICLSGCGAHSSRKPDAQPTPPSQPVVKLEPVKVVGKTETPDALAVYDAETLFQRGNEFLDTRNYVEARQYFQKLLNEFPDASLANAARYNLGVALMETGDPQSALNQFDTYMQTASAKDARDATFKRGACLAMLGRYPDVVNAFDSLLEQEDLDDEDRVEALVDSGIGYFMLKDRATAEYRFNEAVKLRRKIDEGAPPPYPDYHTAQALFYLAEILRLEYSEFKLEMPTGVNPEEKVAKDLEEKCQRLLRSQYAFIKVIRSGHPGWASAAGYKVGSLYEDLYQEMTTLPVPVDLDQEQAEIYRQQLRKKVAVLVRKAINIYETTMTMAKRTGAENIWVERTEQSLARMRQLIKETEALEEEDRQQGAS